LEREHFKALRRFTIAAAKPCGTERVLAFRDDLQAYVGHSVLFDPHVSVALTGEVERMLVAKCVAAHLGVRPPRLGRELQRLWVHQLSFRYMEAHVLRFDQESDSVALNFLTQLGPSEGFITGAIVATVRRRATAAHVDDDPDDEWGM
jgi:hypothetical protein